MQPRMLTDVLQRQRLVSELDAQIDGLIAEKRKLEAELHEAHGQIARMERDAAYTGDRLDHITDTNEDLRNRIGALEVLLERYENDLDEVESLAWYAMTPLRVAPGCCWAS